jgi:hypothetical protein
MLKIIKAGPKQFQIDGDLDKAAQILMISKSELLTYPKYYEGKVFGERIVFERNADAIAFIGLVQSQVKINKAFGING